MQSLDILICSSTNGICSEIVPSHNASAYIRVLTRFFSRRRTPTFIVSDNGSNFTTDDTHHYAS